MAIEDPKKPRTDRAINLGSLVVGALGVALAVFFFIRGQREREPYYFVQPTRNVIVNRDKSIGDKLSISYKGQQLDTAAVTALQINFWNAGKEPIKRSDILIPIKLSLASGNRLLDASILRQTRPSVVNFTVSESSGNSVQLNFEILEFQDGATIQVVFEGAPDAEIRIEGTAVGSNISRLQIPFGKVFNESLTKSTLFMVALFPLLILVAPPIVFFFLSILDKIKLLDSGTEFSYVTGVFIFYVKKKSFWIVAFVWILLVASVYYIRFIYTPMIPTDLSL